MTFTKHVINVPNRISDKRPFREKVVEGSRPYLTFPLMHTPFLHLAIEHVNLFIVIVVIVDKCFLTICRSTCTCIKMYEMKANRLCNNAFSIFKTTKVVNSKVSTQCNCPKLFGMVLISRPAILGIRSWKLFPSKLKSHLILFNNYFVWMRDARSNVSARDAS